MTARRTSIRTTLAVATVAVVAAALNGCAVTPEGTGTTGEDHAEKTNQSLAVVGVGGGIVVAPPPPSYFNVTYPISDYTYAPVPDGAQCISTTVAVPADLAAYGCSYGVEISDYSKDLYGYVWACPSDVVIPTRDLDGFGLPAPGLLCAFSPCQEGVHISNTLATSCFGTPLPGYSLVVNTYTHIITGGCTGSGCANFQ